MAIPTNSGSLLSRMNGLNNINLPQAAPAPPPLPHKVAEAAPPVKAVAPSVPPVKFSVPQARGQTLTTYTPHK